MFVTAQTTKHGDLLGEVDDALEALHVDAVIADDILLVDGSQVALRLIDRAHPTPAELAHMVSEAPSGHAVVVIADRISEPGREVLRRAGWGWLDRRGHARVWAPGIRIEAPLPQRGDPHPGISANPWTTVGLELALAAILHPDEPVTARHFAPVINRSVGAVHELVTRFAKVGLVGNASRLPLMPDLFWETAAHWPDGDWFALPVELAEVTERLGSDALLRVDERAATLGGARIPAIGDLPARGYLPTASALRRVRSLADHHAPTRCWVRVAPVTYLPENTEHPPSATHPWRVAHPIICALRLAADPARGREVVEDWGIVPGEPA